MLGIIGGTGFYKMDRFNISARKSMDTPFGKASSEVSVGEIEGRPVAFLPRHGESHQLIPSEINFRANIWALKAVGVRKIVSVSAVGSLREEIRAGDLVIPDQYFDWTRGKRNGSFFGEGVVAHVSTAHPSCANLRHKIESAATHGIHTGKTYACVEGPRLGTRAESLFLRQAGCDIVGMTNIPEVFLAREAQICYATVAIATDYDCWLEDPAQHATVDKVIELYMKNVGKVQDLISALLASSVAGKECECRHSLKNALMTREDALPEGKKAMLAFLKE
jgi:5'-methylthioadenosine phosphorylase